MRYDRTADNSQRVVEFLGIRVAVIRTPDDDFAFRVAMKSSQEDFSRWANRVVLQAQQQWASRATSQVLRRALATAEETMTRNGRYSLMWLPAVQVRCVVLDELAYRASDPAQSWEGTPMAASML